MTDYLMQTFLFHNNVLGKDQVLKKDKSVVFRD